MRRRLIRHRRQQVLPPLLRRRRGPEPADAQHARAQVPECGQNLPDDDRAGTRGRHLQAGQFEIVTAYDSANELSSATVSALAELASRVTVLKRDNQLELIG